MTPHTREAELMEEALNPDNATENKRIATKAPRHEEIQRKK